jgi:hypothetical protein
MVERLAADIIQFHHASSDVDFSLLALRAFWSLHLHCGFMAGAVVAAG